MHTLYPLQHEAAHEGKKVVHNCLNYPQVNAVKTLTPLGIVFSHPEMAIVGQSYKQLKDNGVDFVTCEASYERQGRAIVLGKNKGAIEVYIERGKSEIAWCRVIYRSYRTYGSSIKLDYWRRANFK